MTSEEHIVRTNSTPLAATRDARLDDLLQREVIDVGAAPSAVVAWSARASNSWSIALGAAGAQDDAVFDLASVTKPMTALAAMRLVADGVLSLESTVGAILPELDGSAAAEATLVDLLSHRAGLPAWGALYRSDPWSVGTETSTPPSLDDPFPSLSVLLTRAASRRDARAVGPAAAPIYSDLSYVLAGAMIARASHRRLDAHWESLSGATSARRWRARGPSSDFDARVLPTERVEWRGGDVRGVVHDENAYFLERSDGDPGHAGAFGAVLDVALVAARFLDALDDRDDLLPASLARRMIEPFAVGTNRIGWDGLTPGASQSGTRFGPRTFGHLGFTGTSVWVDPDGRVFAVLLTNRTYPTRANVAIRTVRPRVHDALWSILGA